MSYFNLFSTCIPTKGVNRSIIADLQREEVFHVSNEIFDLIEELNFQPIGEVLKKYDEESRKIANEIINDLVTNELGHLTNHPELFPSVSQEWDSPDLITNAIVDYNLNSKYDLYYVLKQLSKVSCKHIQFRFYDHYPKDKLLRLIKMIYCSDSVVSIELFLKSSKYLTTQWLTQVIKKYPVIKSIYVHSSNMNIVEQLFSEEERGKMGNIFRLTRKINNESHCGIINESFATSLGNLEAYMEAQNFNSCLNRKIGIDTNGFVRNCPSMKNHFGKVDEINIIDVIKSDEFQVNWQITKKQISICNICEYRNICSDCRAYTINDNAYEKPKKCLYDPYKNVWEN